MSEIGLKEINKDAISFKRLSGKAHTQFGFDVTEEGLTSNVQIAASTVFGEKINPNPADNPSALTSLYSTDGVVERVRFEIDIIASTTVGTNQSQGYKLKLPSDYNANGVLNNIFGSGTYLHEALGRLQIVPSLYGDLKNDGTTQYDATLFDTNLNPIPKFSDINWNLDPYSGILFVQDPPALFDGSAARPRFLDAYLYVGKFLDSILTGATSENQSGTSERIEKQINQTSHGFAVGDVLISSGNTYNKALAIEQQPEALGVVTVVEDVDNFTLTYAGYTDLVAGMTDDNGDLLSVDTVYYLSDVEEGKLTATPPVTVGDILKPMMYVIESNTSANIFQVRGNVITSGSTNNEGDLLVVNSGAGAEIGVTPNATDTVELRTLIGSGNTTVTIDGNEIIINTISDLFNAFSYTGVTISGDSTTSEFAIGHNFNTRDVIVQVYQAQSPYGWILVSTERTDENTVTINFQNAPDIGVNFRVLIFSATEGNGSSSGGASGSTFGEWIDIDNQSSLLTNVQIPLQYRFDDVLDSEIVYFRGQFGRNINSPNLNNWVIGNVPAEARPTYDYIIYREKGNFSYRITVTASNGNIILNSVDNDSLPLTAGGINDVNPYSINDAFYRPNHPYNVEISQSQDYVGFEPTTYNGTGVNGSQSATATIINADQFGNNLRNTIKDYSVFIDEIRKFDNDTTTTQSIVVSFIASNSSINRTYNQVDNTHTGTTLQITSADNPRFNTQAFIFFDFTTPPEPIAVCPNNNTVSTILIDGDASNVDDDATIDYGVFVIVDSEINFNDYEISASITPEGGGFSLLTINYIVGTNKFEVPIERGIINAEVEIRFNPRTGLAPPECSEYITQSIAVQTNSNSGGL